MPEIPDIEAYLEAPRSRILGQELLGIRVANPFPELSAADAEQFRAALLRKNHTLKWALTDPRILSGIGNACSDEILHRARLSPLKQTDSLIEEEFARLHAAVRHCRTAASPMRRTSATTVRAARPEGACSPLGLMTVAALLSQQKGMPALADEAHKSQVGEGMMKPSSTANTSSQTLP